MTRAMAVLSSLLLVASIVDAAQQGAQPPRDASALAAGPATARISGTVTSADTGAPLRGVDIRITGGASPAMRRPLVAVTDAEGRYEVDELPAGSYTLTASKTGYVTLSYGQTRPVQDGRTVQVAASQRLANIDVALPRGAVIVVRLADVLGDPAAGFRVVAYQPRFENGERRLTAVTSNFLHVADDRGEIRLSGLAPGEYFIGALPGGVAGSTLQNPRGKDPQTFYPGAISELDAQPVVVGLGDEVSVAIQLLGGGKLARISGVIDGDERPTIVQLMRRVLGSTSSLSIDTAPDGRFTATNLPPGEYTIVARAIKEAGTLRVQVGEEDISNLVVSMKPATTVRGRFTFDGGKPPSAAWTQFRLALPDDSGFTRFSVISNDFTFEVPAVMGRGVLRLQDAPPDWLLKAVVVGGKDVTDTEMDYAAFAGRDVEVVVTPRAPHVTGMVVDQRGASASDYVVVLFAEDSREWTAFSRTIAAVRSNQRGGFSVRMPPGRYLIAALDYLQPGRERDHATLERLRAGAVPLTLTEGASQEVTLKLAP